MAWIIDIIPNGFVEFVTSPFNKGFSLSVLFDYPFFRVQLILIHIFENHLKKTRVFNEFGEFVVLCYEWKSHFKIKLCLVILFTFRLLGYRSTVKWNLNFQFLNLLFQYSYNIVIVIIRSYMSWLWWNLVIRYLSVIKNEK